MTLFALVPLAIWIYLLLGRGFFWLMRERDTGTNSSERFSGWPSVTAIVPARDEADVVERTLKSLFAQDYPGQFRVVLVDDQSTDGTAEAAGRAANACDEGGRFTLVRGTPRPQGWTGKVWAMHQGFLCADDNAAPDFLLFTDADIAHAPDNLRNLVLWAESANLVLASLMAKLHCRSLPERLLVPAFVFFFAMLYPFGWANDPAYATAAAAGGCMLVRRNALRSAGGLETISDAIIDDCALARVLKRQGRTWLGLSNRACSIRPYSGFGEIGQMVSRSAYAQLHYSPAVLCGTLIGMIVVYAVPPFLAFFSAGTAKIESVLAWLLMAGAYQPILRFYRVSPLWGVALPLIGAIYSFFTLNSAIEYWRGRGGMWKGRAQAIA
ncbi:MAG TPA: glycosyltransferase [Rhizomicrobium sp.]|jgi:hopene-associated glycosyltransferase HpnB